uniref:F5/8 type C domain-containing protein n=1 Tax=Hucho hucho TaxID=62062 RepID=A0A4W5N376_9TELE
FTHSLKLNRGVTSVLNRDVQQFGKKYMFDSNEEACWNSDQGDSQWVPLEFPQSIRKMCKLEGYLYIYSDHHNSLDSDHFFVILVRYSSTLSLKGYNDNEGEVQTCSAGVFICVVSECRRAVDE